MEKESILEKIKSKYIIQTIDSYIEAKKLIFKLFVYSKKLQKKINVSLLYYQENFFNKIFKWYNIKDYEKLENQNNSAKDNITLQNNFANNLKILNDKNISTIFFSIKTMGKF